MTDIHIEQLKELKVAKIMCMTDSLFFTRYFFKKRYKRSFEVGEHHIRICQALDDVISGKIKRLMINIGPRFGKTELAVINFIAQGLALNASAKFLHLSYSDDLAVLNSETIRDFVKEPFYQQLFPFKLKQSNTSKKRWATAEGGGVYATSMGGQVTGFGAGKVDESNPDDESKMLDEFFAEMNIRTSFGGAMIIDDFLKPEDANSEIERNKVNTRYDSTIRNRTNSRNTPIIIIAHRLHENDLCGHLLEVEGDQWTVLAIPAINEDGSALWPHKMTLEELEHYRNVDPVTFERQYMQDPQPLKGRLYKKFKFYKALPKHAHRKAVIDTADDGSDYLCMIIYDSMPENYYLVDVYYTQDGAETTEEETADRLTTYGVAQCVVESNNGGKSFARNVERLLRLHGNRQTDVSWYHQSDNKESRIFNGAAEVQNMIVYPEDWLTRWPAFSKHVKSYMASGTNAHDDAEDALTMVVEAERGDGVYGLSS